MDCINLGKYLVESLEKGGTTRARGVRERKKRDTVLHYGESGTGGRKTPGEQAGHLQRVLNNLSV